METDPWAHPRSLYSKLPWIPRHWALPIVTGILGTINVVLLIVMLVMDIFHDDYFTYWNYIMTTLFLVETTITYPLEGWTAAVPTMLYTPVVMGCTALTVDLVLIIIAVDERVYIGGTAADSTASKVLWTFSQIRTGDWIIHGLPLLEILVVLLFDYQIYFRALIYHWERSAEWYSRWWYWVWFYFSPLIPLLVYMLFNDPTAKYTSRISLGVGFAIAFGLNLIHMTVYALSLRMSELRGIRLPDFYPAYLHPPPTKSR